MNPRSRLTQATLDKLITDTGMNWKDSSYHNDMCESVSLDLSGISIQVWVPNAEVTNEDKEETANYMVQATSNQNAEVLYEQLIMANYETVLFIVRAILMLFNIKAKVNIQSPVVEEVQQIEKRINSLIELADARKISQISFCDLAPQFGWSEIEYRNRTYIREQLEKRGYTVETSVSHGVIDMRVFRGIEKKV